MILSDSISPIASIAPVVSLTEATDKQLALYAELIYRRTGIRVVPQKKTLLSNRVRRRLRETGIEGFDEYYERLTRLPADDPEWDEFLQEITTHETYLFRDENQWKWFRETYLPQCAAEAQSGSRRARCESGRPPAARATRRSPPPAASPLACPAFSGGKSASSARTLGPGRWRRPRPPSSPIARCG